VQATADVRYAASERPVRNGAKRGEDAMAGDATFARDDDNNGIFVVKFLRPGPWHDLLLFFKAVTWQGDLKVNRLQDYLVCYSTGTRTLQLLRGSVLSSKSRDTVLRL